MVDDVVFRMEDGSYQAVHLCLCLYIIWSSWSPQPLHMIWYSSAHWSMANCTVSLFFTSLHIPTFKLLKLDLRTWIHSSTPSLSFRGKPLGCSQVNEHGLLWQKKLTWENTNTFCTQATQQNSPVTLSFSLFVFWSTSFHVFGYICIKYEWSSLTETEKLSLNVKIQFKIQCVVYYEADVLYGRNIVRLMVIKGVRKIHTL